jgi:hypothetical protein
MVYLFGDCCVEGHKTVPYSETQQDAYNKNANCNLEKCVHQPIYTCVVTSPDM